MKPVLLRFLISSALIGIVIWQLDRTTLWQLLQNTQVEWLVAAFVLLSLQIFISAWRWRYTAAQLGMVLTGATAVREYYLATLINQVLPGGVLGDAQRAWRHSKTLARRSPAFQAVVIERLSGQIAMVALAVVALPIGSLSTTLAVSLMIIASVALVLWIVRRQAQVAGWLQAVRVALLNPPVLLVQLVASLLAAIACVAAFACCVVAINPQAGSSLGHWLPLIPLVLFTMLIPITVAGWGLREGAAAALWGWAMLPAAQGVAAAILYGFMALITALPGLLVLLRRGSPA
ncbi:MAG: flippase-like domain-containing protein [Gammaproteobacteria bacterium]|nr:flippase-like domain-containing protein [Gammaproteobacteria bacterium]